MKRLLTLVILLGACFGMHAKPIKGKVVSDADHSPVANATLQVEYVDTIITYEADKKGRFSIDPLSFPVTITTRGVGMLDGIIGLMSMPDSNLVIELTPDGSGMHAAASRHPYLSGVLYRRLSSTFIVRTPASKK